MGLIDVIKKWFEDRVQHKTVKLVYARIPAERVSPSAPGEPLKSGDRYFRLTLAEMYLKHDERWFTTIFPVVHSSVVLSVGTQPIVEIVNVAGPLKLQSFSQPQLSKVVALRFPMTGLLPFNGGVVQLAAGMVAVEVSNSLGSFLSTMEDFAGMLATPPIAAALNIASAVASGVQKLLAAGNGQIEVALHDTFSDDPGGNPIAPGYLAVILASSDELSADTLWVKDGMLHAGKKLEASAPLTGYTYMLFRIDVRGDHENWEALTSIAAPFHKALELALTNPNEAEAQIRAAILAAWQSPDLTRLDRKRVAKQIKQEFDDFRSSAGLRATDKPRPTLASVMFKAPSPEAWAAAPPVSLEELLGGGAPPT